jgi:4-hydroxy-L-threonine phosphate dehydrogenase PdxA
MFMVGEQLRIGIVTGHIPLNEVAAKITKEAILKKIQLMHESLVKDFGIDTPKIAVLGLNPHASDNGAIGEEEINQIIPAIAAARAKRMFVFGPYAADGFFGAGSFAKYDGIIAMFHDQGLTPFKTLEFHGGVNFTAGLSIVRTSPDHGTGFDIAGQDIASPDSFRQAVFMAIDIVRHRRNYAEMTANPLRQQEIADIKRGLEEGGDDGVIREQKSYQ